MKSFSSLDLFYFMSEVKEFCNGRIETFYYDPPNFYMKIYRKSKGNIFLKNNLGKYIYFEENKPKSPELHPFPFILFLRKQLKNSYVTSVENVPGERVIKIICEKKNENVIEKYYLFIELFSSGNIILTDTEHNILHVLEKKTFKDRSLKKSGVYELPPNKNLTIETLNEKTFNEHVKISDLQVGKFIAISVGIGGKYAKHVCFKLGLSQDRDIKTLEDNELNKLFIELKTLPEKNLSPSVQVNQKLEFEDFYPIDISFKDTITLKQTNTFNQALAQYYKQFEIKKDRTEEELLKQLEKLHRRLQSQLEQRKTIEHEYELLLSKGNLIYEHYSEINDLLNTINQKSKTEGWDSVLQSIQSNPVLSKIISNIKPDKNEIEINFDELEKLKTK